MLYTQIDGGAIAVDSATNDVGTASAMPSKNAAIEKALADCRLHGSTNCDVALSYYNPCAAIARGHPKSSYFSAATAEEAKRHTLSRCGENSGDCKVVYTDCSYAQRIQ
ncbi:DUF4189 domain-containing protein [Dyella sp.]|uniref:DUF4189 domain-containing protein n=1 Tax=Dyella sp. TaxID=1869338 RepID=UPI0039C87232